MKYSLILNKFEIDLSKLKRKLKSFEIDKLTGRINTDNEVELEEVDKILVLENENFFSLEDSRKDISKIKFNEFNLRVKSYVKIPSGTIKKKLYLVVNKKEFETLLNKAKKLTKGKLSEFNVEVIKDLKELDYVKIGFSKHSKKNEKDFVQFVKKNNKRLLFVFGNDTYGLSQKTRDSLDVSFSLGPDKVKPMKANQALAYVLGIYSNL